MKTLNERRHLFEVCEYDVVCAGDIEQQVDVLVEDFFGDVVFCVYLVLSNPLSFDKV